MSNDNDLNDNDAIVRRWFEEVWNERRDAAIDELLPPESVCYTDDGVLRGAEEFRERQFLPFVTAFPDLRVEIEATLAQNDQVVVRWSAVGTHSGDGLGIAPTGRPARFRGISWIRLCDGKFREGWQSSNIPEMLRELAAATPG